MEKLAPLLEKLATKLGVTVEMLWGVMLKQAFISAMIDFTQCVAMVIGVTLLFRFVQRKTTKPADTERSYGHAEWEDEGAVLAWLTVGVLLVITSVICLSAFDSIVTALTNPQYWALKHLLGACK